MKRFIVAAIAAGALAMPAGASAQDVGDVADVRVAAPCWTTYSAEYCAKQLLSSIAVIDLGDLNQCTTPLMPCIQETIGKVFTTADYAVWLAKYYAAWAYDQVNDPPNLDPVCYAIWGQPCGYVV